MASPMRFCPPLEAVCAGALSLALAGCYPWDSEVVGEPGKTGVLMPEPNGAFVHKMQEVQSGKAQASNYVIFLDEWYKGGAALGPYGTYHLTHMAPKLAKVTFPIVIQPSPEAALNETRRQQVVAALVKLGFADAEQRVIIAYPDAEGLYGDEAPRTYLDMLRPHTNLNGANGAFGANGAYGGYGGYQGFNGLSMPYLGGYGLGMNPFGY